MPPETPREGTPPVPPPRPSHLAFDPITVPTPNPFDLFEGASTSSAPAATHEGVSIARPLRPIPPPDYVSEWNFSDNPNHHAEGLSPMTTENAIQKKVSLEGTSPHFLPPSPQHSSGHTEPSQHTSHINDHIPSAYSADSIPIQSIPAHFPFA
ncbi:hypothetical protein SCP_0903630 [Sparassis crispa]|uniref:Uncharacterized protein n=1 Tax=Sparassis crispa TaxID=139825 RepID=A0A401GXI1_9APHY|nr:hypothetical protein SCP_0903630 [Sparassis crispa]GBE86484.1 hypothetical protein SCP_0903630 [Sparassis crispa]